MMKEKIITRNFLCTFTAQLCLALVMYTLMSTITEYVTAMGASVTIAGLVSGLYVVGGLFSRIYSGSAIAPVILGAIAASSDYHVLYYVSAAISLTALPIYWYFWGRKRVK